MKTITIMNVKGGVGKTASAANIAYVLAKKFKKKVLLIDTDAQGNVSDFFFEKKETKENEDKSVGRMLNLFRKALNGESAYKSKTLEDILLDATCEIDIHDCMISTMNENLFVIPSEITLTTAERKLNADITTPIQFRIKNHLDKAAHEFDYCIFDCAPYLTSTTTNALVCTDMVYTPLRPDMASLKGLAVTLNLIREVQTFVPQMGYGGAFFTATERGKHEKIVLQIAKQVLEENLPGVLIPLEIRKSKIVEESTYTQTPLLETGKEGKLVSDDYVALTEYIMKKIN